MNTTELIPHLFRTEYRKIVSVLCKQYGFEQMGIAEDIAADTFLAAYQSWPINGVPPNAVAWLHYVSKNKARNYLKRKLLFDTKITRQVRGDVETFAEMDIDLSPQNAYDSQLQMMFALCHPVLPPEAQVALALRVLCGFGIEEIADAFLTNKETINKRLFRAKERLRQENIQVEFPKPSEITQRLEAVLTTIYLLFNEGYYSISQNPTIRKELCQEAIRLCEMLLENESTSTPPVVALLALMCFHMSRIDARYGKNEELILYHEQDAGLWDAELISRGAYLLSCSAVGEEVSKYHIEATIAYWSTRQEDTSEKWENVLRLYDLLLEKVNSPVVVINRIFALWKVYGRAAAIAEAEVLEMEGDHFYFMLMGELYSGIDTGKARGYFMRALSLARTAGDKKTIQKRIDRLSDI